MFEPIKDPNRGLGLGVALAFLLHIFQIPLLVLAGELLNGEYAFAPILFIGLSQLVYILPAILLAHRRKKGGVVKGLCIGAGITFLLNGTCLGVMRLV
ncbi:MAG: hypothetical protein ACREEM_03805 [Blastocatellia bacterium]